MDIFEAVKEEIALEGLDGITIPTLWIRIAIRKAETKEKFPNLNENFKEYLWSFCCSLNCIQIFKLPSPRDEPELFDRFSGFNEDTATHVAVAPDELGTIKDVYPIELVSVNGVRGSCATFEKRIEITSEVNEKKLTLKETLNIYGKKCVVLVASQHARSKVLAGKHCDSTFVEKLQNVQYCVLERIGRSRTQGELQSFLNNNTFKCLKRSHIHHITKDLFAENLIVKQSHSYRISNRTVHQILLQLTHMHRELRSSYMKYEVEIKKLLSKNRYKRFHWTDIQNAICLSDCRLKKLKKKLLDKKVVIQYPAFPEGSKRTRLFVKLNEEFEPTVSDNEEVVKEVIEENIPPLVWELPIITQCYHFLVSKGGEGCEQSDFLKILKGYGGLEARSICRMLTRFGKIKIVMIDRGAQRVQRIIAKDFEQSSLINKDFLAARKLMSNLIRNQSQPTPASSENVLLALDYKDTSLKDQSSTSVVEYVPKTPLSDPDKTLNEFQSLQTARSLSRTNTILTFINERKVVEGTLPFRQVLMEIEESGGHKICRKTIKNIVGKLVEQGLMHKTRFSVTFGETTVESDYYLSLNATLEDIEYAKNSAKFRIFSQDWQQKCETLFNLKDMDEKNEAKKVRMTSDEVGDRETRFKKKYQRSQIIHEYLWYLAYGHPNQGSMIPDFKEIHVYNDEYSWKRYLPPVPRTNHNINGWLKLRDIIVQLPLVTLAQFHNLEVTDEIAEYLDNWDKRNYLVRHLPPGIIRSIIHKNRYRDSLNRTLERLCFMGLVSFSTKKNRRSILLGEMVYVHRNASLVNTSPSRKGYMCTSEDIVYEHLPYHFDCLETVQNYWLRMRTICFTTELGHKKEMISDDGKEVQRYSNILRAYVEKHMNREDDEDVKDEGSIPGDGKGAAGFDSSMFIHLFRNWDSCVKKLSEEEIRACNFPGRAKRLTKLTPSVVRYEDPSKQKSAPAVKLGAPAQKRPKLVKKTSKKTQRSRKRNVNGDRNEVEKKKTRIEKEDLKMAVKGVRVRHSFTKDEDELLIKYNATSTILQRLLSVEGHLIKLSAVSWMFVFNLFKKTFKDTKKTPDSLRRRCRFIMRNYTNIIKHDLTVAYAIENRENEDILRILQNHQVVPNEVETERVYLQLLKYVEEQKGGMSKELMDKLPDTIDDIQKNCIISTFTMNLDDSELRLKTTCLVSALNTPDDIEISRVENLIYSAFFSDEEDRASLSAQKGFLSVSKSIVREVFDHLRKKAVVPLQAKKRFREEKKFLPFGVPAYPLSKFFMLFKSDFILELVNSVNDVLQNFLSTNHTKLDMSVTAGHVITLLGLQLRNKAFLEIDTKNPEMYMAKKEIKTDNVPEEQQQFRLNIFNKSTFDYMKANTEFFNITIKNNSHNQDLTDPHPNHTNVYHTLSKMYQGASNNKICGLDILESTEIALAQIESVTYSTNINDARHYIQNDSLSNLILKILKKKSSPQYQLGYVEERLKKILIRKTPYSKEEISKSLNQLIKFKLIYRVGSLERRLVLHEYASSWFTVAHHFDQAESSKSKWSTHRFLCRPWHSHNGKINFKAIKKILSSVVDHIFNNTGCTLLDMSSKFAKMLQKVVLLETIDVLLTLKCIERRCSSRGRTWEFFTETSSCHPEQSDNYDYLVVTDDCLFRFSFFIASIETYIEKDD